MSSNVQGFKNEQDMINYLSEKMFCELNDNMKEFINFLFPFITKDNIIKIKKGETNQKPDVIITVDEVSKKISLKMGNGNSVHQENIDLFTSFLTELDVPEMTIQELLLFHWGDNTTDGSGSSRITSKQWKNDNEDKLVEINKILNNNNKLKQIINRILFQGKSNNFNKVDCIYYGDINDGLWATDDEIIKYILNNQFNGKSIHFGPLNYQVWNRCINRNPKTEKRRTVMQIKWPSLKKDLINIEELRDFNE